MTNKELKKIGEITHYFSDLEVAIIKFSKEMKVGDQIRVIGGEDTDFTQEIEGMEMDHEKVEKVKKGEQVGIKVKEKVREGYEVYSG
jgi:translation elongation factor EF-Tu-like GTPase